MFVKRSLLISLITHATVEACSDTDLVLSARARTLVKGERLKSIIRGLLHQQSTDPGAVVRSLRAGLQVYEVQNVIDELLYQSDMNSKRTYFELPKKPTILESSLYNKIKNTLLIVDYLNAPLCKLKIEAILAPLTSFDHRAADTVITAFIDQATYTNTDIMKIWASLLSGLPPYQAIQVSQPTYRELKSPILTRSSSDKGNCRESTSFFISHTR